MPHLHGYLMSYQRFKVLVHVPIFPLSSVSSSRWLIDSDTEAIVYPADASASVRYAFDAFLVDESATAELLLALGSGNWVGHCNPRDSVWYPDAYSFN